MDRISLKIGIVFFITILMVEGFLFYFLHSSIIHSRIDEELDSLLTRGNNHRDILETSYTAETIHHITTMESRTETHVVITGQNGEVVASSIPVDQYIQNIITAAPDVPRTGLILEDDWQDKKYIASVSPLEANGNVYMFKNTQRVQGLIARLNRHFWLAGILLLSSMVVITLFLSRFITKPVIKMNEATLKIRQGDYSVALPRLGNDELGELGESIKVLADDLNHIKQQRSEFLASISHELRTPLTYIKGYADIAGRESTSPEDKSKYLQIINEEAARLSDLVKSLFDLAKMDENTFPIQKEPLELCGFLHSIQMKMLPSFQEKNIMLNLICDEESYIEADPVRFEQIVINLLDNARKYSAAGTTTTIHAFKKSGRTHLTIEDEGKGIPKEDQAWVFDRFYRVDKSRSSSLGGSGLGLAIVKELVEAHGGKIRLKSEPGKGTIFEIIL
ncbi:MULTISPECIES: HAMP domain-containing sensor histidine kinase [unclassified Mesobacillus]|uniref:sensor histidine kinase n=1 Tax=unclassified Mesobacillus TaxID=2675270 RepID=UPI00203CD155|nr:MULTISPECIES: HAMP domain-containing sensor histidine kinase [unclassified Mesobacillus]MCM3123990.1 HAMP domain-containing histidine kinase [Mesobacillus sp. MER 33]MCM3233839.1 HAMP domain-containing histidine kinase [Mesobacillus sp. MER 48]